MKKLNLFLLAIICIVVLYITIHFKDFDFTNKAYKIYKQGIYFEQNADYQNSYYNFSKIPKYSPLYKFAIIHQAQNAYKLSDYKTAINYYLKYVNMFPDTILTPKAYYYLGLSYYKDKEYKSAYHTFNNLSKKYPKTNFGIAANYYLGLINENIHLKSKEETLNYFIKYLSLAPDGTLSKNVLKEVKKLDVVLSNENKKIIGIAAYKNNMYSDCIFYLNQLKDPNDWSYLANSYMKTNHFGVAQGIFEKGLKSSNANLDKDELYEGIENYVSLFQNKKNGWLKARSAIEQNSLKSGLDFVLYNLAKYENEKNAINYYQTIYKNFENGDFASESLWEIFWYYYKNKSYKTAKMYALKHVDLYNNTQASPRILFWLGKICQHERNYSAANSYFKDVITKYPNSYYAFRANSKLNNKNDVKLKRNYKPLSEKIINPQFPINYTKLSPKDMSLVMKIIDLDDYSLLEQVDFDTKFIDSWINYKKGNYVRSVNLAKTAFDELDVKPLFYDEVYKLVYPLHYAPKINAYSSIWNLDPYLVISLIKEESYFNTNAKSIYGAVGLMQLMPSTANFIAKNYKLYYNSLYNPEDNLKLGTAYLSYVIKDCDNILYAIAGYNGGHNNMKTWQKYTNNNDFDEVIENIPYSESKHYVRKVFSSYWNYKNIYK